jgi:hypothetical protein
VWRRALPALLVVLLGAVRLAHAQSAVLDVVQTIATAATAVPVVHDVTIAASGTYTVQLVDLGAALSAPLASVALAVTSGDAIVGTPLIGAGNLQFTAASAGTYTLRVVGMPGSAPGSGPIGLQVTSSSNAVIFSSSDTLALPAQATPSTVGVLNDTFTPTTSGTYQVTLTDLQFPQSLGGELALLLVAVGGTTPLLELPDASNPNPLQGTVLLQAGQAYRILAIGQTTSTAALYSAVVALSGGAAVESWAIPVGATMELNDALVLSAGTQTLTVTDLAFPTALTQVGVALVLNGQIAAQRSSAGSTPFTASAASYQVFGAAVAATAGAGSYTVKVAPQGGAAEMDVAQAVTASGGTLTGYTFTTNLASAGAASVSLHDYQFPSPLVAGNLAVVQGSAVLGTPLTAPGSVNINATAGPLTLIAFAQGGQGGSLMDVNVAQNGNLVFDQPQGVGAAFNAQKFSVTTAGTYSVTATDLAFPAAFTQLSVIVTQGNSTLGSIFGGGTLPPISASAGGVYFANVIATPAASNSNPAAPVNSGTYALDVTPAPAPPAVTFSADESSVSSGGTVHLVWTTQSATSCTGSGGGWTGTYTGAQAASDSVSSPAITQATTFTLTCMGPGGSTAKTVSIAVSKSGGGGGALGVGALLWLGACLGLARGLRCAA